MISAHEGCAMSYKKETTIPRSCVTYLGMQVPGIPLLFRSVCRISLSSQRMKLAFDNYLVHIFY